jgi:hypothetical protein
MNAEQLLVAALEKIESASIKAWAQTDHNRPIFVKIAESALAKTPVPDVHRFAAYISATAIGL